jgi:beta-phosphoglucomutase-like phosphatase (HAD superfamily)
VAIEDSRNGLLSACGAGITTIVTPCLYTRGEDFAEAALVIDDLNSIDFGAIEAVVR